MVGLFSLIVLAGVICLGLRVLARLPDQGISAMARKVDQLLPQTQCAQCGYAGCHPYAQAIVAGEAEINLCPPGGDEVIESLSRLLNRPVMPLRADLPETMPAGGKAVIDETRCIGCALCLPACPVDAIVGAPQWLHAVLPSRCTGCELCIAPCPVDCIELRSPTVEENLTPPERLGQNALPATLPCIHCGACDDVCPEHLPAKALYQHARLREWDAAAVAGIADCIECELCVTACPAQIPLTVFYRSAKQEIAHRERVADHATVAAARYDRHQKRNEKHQASIATARKKVKDEMMRKISR